MLAALRALETALAEPKPARQGLRRQMVASCAAIAERGPEATRARDGQALHAASDIARYRWLGDRRWQRAVSRPLVERDSPSWSSLSSSLIRSTTASGRLVLVLPGFVANDWYLWPLR